MGVRAGIALVLVFAVAEAGATPAPRHAEPHELHEPHDEANPAPMLAHEHLPNPDLALILDVAGAWFSDEDHLQSGAHDPARTGFNLQLLKLSMVGVVDPHFRVDGNVVLGPEGVELEEAYGTTLDLPLRLQLRFGQFLTRFGRANPTHPHGWDFVDQPFALGRVFGAEGNRALGLELSWIAPLPWPAEVVGSVSHASGEETARSFRGDHDVEVDHPSDLLYIAALKQRYALHEHWALDWGISGAFGPNWTGHDRRTDVFGSDLNLSYQPITARSHGAVTLQVEALLRRRQVPDDVFQDVSLYAQLVWRFTRHWATGARYEYGSRVYDEHGYGVAGSAYLVDPGWSGERHRVASNLTYWPTEFSRLRLQGSVDMPQWRDRPIEAVFLAADLVAGAPAAHGH